MADDVMEAYVRQIIEISESMVHHFRVRCFAEEERFIRSLRAELIT